MKEWTVKSKDTSYTFLTNNITLFKGTVSKWQDEIIDIRNYFNHKKKDIYESNRKIVVQDYELSILSYSQLFNSKSYTDSKKKVEELFFSYLELSPFYKALIDSWSELQEEVDFLVDEIDIPLSIELKNFSKNIVEKHLVTKTESSSPLNMILNEIQLIKSFVKNKKHIFLILAPETILDEGELVKLNTFLTNQNNKFLLFSNYNFDGVTNIKYRNKILNELSLTSLEYKVGSMLPFAWSDVSFNKSIPLFMKLVDNSNDKTVDLSFKSVDNLEIFIYLFILLYLVKIPFRLDTKGIPDQYKAYIESALTNRL